MYVPWGVPYFHIYNNTLKILYTLILNTSSRRCYLCIISILYVRFYGYIESMS